jgi:hypothetical protein
MNDCSLRSQLRRMGTRLLEIWVAYKPPREQNTSLPSVDHRRPSQTVKPSYLGYQAKPKLNTCFSQESFKCAAVLLLDSPSSTSSTTYWVLIRNNEPLAHSTRALFLPACRDRPLNASKCRRLRQVLDSLPVRRMRRRYVHRYALNSALS